MNKLKNGMWVGGSTAVKRVEGGHRKCAVWAFRCFGCDEVFTMTARAAESMMSAGLPVHCPQCTDQELDEKRQFDRVECVNYATCLMDAAKQDCGHVCFPGCHNFIQATLPCPSLLGSMMSWIAMSSKEEEEDDSNG